MKKQRSPLRIAFLLSLFPLTFCSCESAPPCPDEGEFTAEAAKAILYKSLGGGETVKSIVLTPATESLSFTIFADDFSNSLIGPETDLQMNVYPIMEASRRIATCAQRLRTIQARMVVTGPEEKNEYGTELPASDVPIVSLNIDCDDLRKFPPGFQLV